MQRECHNNDWWKRAVIYQVYPRSFQDSNGDGVGDIPGIIQRLDYIVSLGVDTLWINPVFTSPGMDNGYDISDYRSIQPEYGTMADMEQLIKMLHEKGLRIIIDMVLNHTSDEHEWFRQARTSREDPYYDFYIWWPAEKGQPPYRCGFFDPSGEAWHYNEATDSFYLHYFAPQQPDLNWENPRVRQELYAILRFWLDKGIDGFRFDAISFISKDTGWPAITPEVMKEKYQDDWGHCYADGPHLHEYLQEMHREILATHPREVLFLGEASGITADKAPLFVNEDRGELHLLAHFDGMILGYVPGEFKKPEPAGYSRKEFKAIYTRWTEIFAEKGWGTVYLGNHDQPRMLSRWGDDRDEFRSVSAKCLLTFLLTMRATPMIYNGDELGMRNIRFTRVEDYKDIETHQVYEQIRSKGGDAEEFLKDAQLSGRDNGRTPFQWSGGPQAGFTTGTPWLCVNPDHRVVNRDSEEKDPGSVLHFFRRLIQLRRQNPPLTEGDFSPLAHDGSPVYAYTRSWQGTTIAVLLNLSGEEVLFDPLLSSPPEKKILINNYPALRRTRQGLRLAPWQALLFSCGRALILFFLWLFAALRSDAQFEMTTHDRWYKNDLIYNLDVRTYQDSDGDGIGDFKGLDARLSYLKDLGVDVIWLAPFQPSPRGDDGYDVADFYGIDPSCGTPGDFAEFLYHAHSLGIRVIMDMVLAHSSDQHPWFKKAVADTSGPYHSWYVWTAQPPANQHEGMAFPGVQKEVWTWQPQAHEYYFHRFYDFQPHLNFTNPAVMEEGQRILGYWLAQGIDGFRLDAVPFIVEEPGVSGDTFSHDTTIVPALRQFVQWRKSDALLLGEANVLPRENVQYFGKMGEGLEMMFNFYCNQYLFYALATGHLQELRHALKESKEIPRVAQWAWFLRNHDEVDLGRLTDSQRQEIFRRFGPGKNMQLYDRGIRRRLAPMLNNPAQLKMAYSLLFSLPGAPVIHYGEELGMGDDLSLNERLAVRTPMQWTAGANAGFTTAAHPFRPVIREGPFGSGQINVQTEERDSASLLNHIRQLVRLRRECPEIGLGQWSVSDSSQPDILSIRYDYEGRSLLILHNFAPTPRRAAILLSDEKGLLDLSSRSTLPHRGKEDIDITLPAYGFKWYRILR